MNYWQVGIANFLTRIDRFIMFVSRREEVSMPRAIIS